jgi:hypothetical protein
MIFLSIKRVAAKIGSVAFLEPEIVIEPDSFFFSFDDKFLHQ